MKRQTAWTNLTGFALVALTLLLMGGDRSTQARELIFEELVELVADDSPYASTEAAGDQDFPGGAALKTDPDSESRLKKAQQLYEEGRIDLACRLWQMVLDEASETVITRGDEWTYKTFKRKYRRYRSVAGEIEQTIAGLPPVGLRMYRLSADADAQAILAAGKGSRREEALSNVVRRYFLSSHGDDAAYELACLRMDRYDFVGASRLLSKILKEYPDYSVPKQEIELRLAVASARVGDKQTAEAALAAIESSDSYLVDRVTKLVTQDLAGQGREGPVRLAANQWPMQLGNAARTGHMKSLPAGLKDKTLSELWVQPFFLTPSTGDYQFPVHREFETIEQSKRPLTQPQAINRAAILGRWKQSGWRPTGEILIVEGMVYYKSADRVVCRNLETGELVWMGRRNQYFMDQLTQFYAQQGQVQGRTIPRQQLDVLLFGDRVHQGMAVADNLLVAVEGPLADVPGAGRPRNQEEELRRRHGYGYNPGARRTRRNFLAAYDAKNGKLKWHTGDFVDKEGKYDIGFMSAPVPYARFLLVPASDSGTLWLYAIERKTGKLVWRSFLCEEPMSAASPFSPVTMAVDGGDAYISTGCGAIFAVDALSGATRWVVRYERSGGGAVNPQHGHQFTARIAGWHEDMVIPHGKALMVMASDSNELFAVDRRTGEFLWESPRVPSNQDAPGEYCLGVVGDSLYIAGKDVVRRYDAKGGRMKWEARLQGSLGRGALTADSVYIPEQDSIVRLDLKGGKRLSQVNVFSTGETEGEPVGNLYTDGQQLLAYGLGRVYSLTDLTYRLELLEKRIAAGETDAYLERMRLRVSDNNPEGALEDLQAAYDRMLKADQPEQGLATLFNGLDEIALVEHDPVQTLALVAAAPRSIVEDSELPAKLLEQRRTLLYRALEQVIDGKPAGSVEQVLAASPLCDTNNLESASRLALAAVATKDDADLLQTAIKHEDVRVRTLALSALDTALGEDARPLLREMLDDPSDKLKIEAAESLSAAGEKPALVALGELLDSEDQEIRTRSVKTLRTLTGQRFKYSAYEKPDERLAAANAWREWIDKNGDSFKLNPVPEGGKLPQGRTLICYYSQHKLVELDSQRREVWSTEVRAPWGCQGLPNGHRLVASYSDRVVIEFDADGKETWRSNALPGGPFSVSRLENGNTLVACTDSGQVVEISPDKEIAWTVKLTGRPTMAQRLDNGNTLVALQTGGRVVEVDREGKVVWEVGNQEGVLSAYRLDNGNTLVSCSSTSIVREIDYETKKEIRRLEGFSNPYDAIRLPDGGTMVVDFRGVHEFDAKDELIWKTKHGNGASRVSRY